MSKGPRETAYDDKIYPLMTQIIAICKEHDIPLLASFELDPDEEAGPMLCTTIVPGKGFESGSHRQAAAILQPRPLLAFAETTVTNPDGSSTTTIRRVT